VTNCYDKSEFLTLSKLLKANGGEILDIV